MCIQDLDANFIELFLDFVKTFLVDQQIIFLIDKSPPLLPVYIFVTSHFYHKIKHSYDDEINPLKSEFIYLLILT